MHGLGKGRGWSIQDPVKLNLDFFQKGRFHHFSGQPIPIVNFSHSIEGFFSIPNTEFLVKQLFPLPLLLPPCNLMKIEAPPSLQLSFCYWTPVIRFPLSLLFPKMRKLSLIPLEMGLNPSPILRSSLWLYGVWQGCYYFSSQQLMQCYVSDL